MVIGREYYVIWGWCGRTGADVDAVDRDGGALGGEMGSDVC